jgi:hypothetical protein
MKIVHEAWFDKGEKAFGDGPIGGQKDNFRDSF